MATTSAFLQARIDALAARITAYEGAALAFGTNGLQQEYRYDTGQTIITVERMDGASIERMIASLINQHAVMCVRAGQTPGAHNSRGAW